MKPVLPFILVAAIAASFSSRIEIVAAAAVTVCGVAWIADREALRRVLRVGLLVGAIFAAAAATAAVAWSSGLDRGLTIGGTVLLRLVVLGTSAALVARSVDAERILSAASRLGLSRLGMVFGLALNSLPHLSETAMTVWSAHRVRSGGRWAALRRIPGLAEVLLAHTGRVAEQAAAAAALRGHAALGGATRQVLSRTRLVVVTGPTGSGKTPLVAAVAERLLEDGVPIAGFLQPAVRRDDVKIGFRIRDVATGETADLARKVASGEGDFGTSFEFLDTGFELGNRALGGIAPGSVLIIDELGPVELRGGGHWPAVEGALEMADLSGMLVVVRRTLVPALIEALGAEDAVVVDLETTETDPADLVRGLLMTEE